MIKLDRKFFDDGDGDHGKAIKIVGHMIALARELGMTVVAEGVETEEQVEFLRREQCDLIQGYYYSKPVPAEEVLKQMQD